MFARLEVISSERTTLTSRNLPSAWISGESVIEVRIDNAMGILPPRGQPVFADLVAHRAQADAQHFGGMRSVARRGIERHFKQTFLHGVERHSCPQSGERGLPCRPGDFGRWEITKKFHMLVWQRRRPANYVRELANVARPGMLCESRHERVGELCRPAVG